MTVPVHLCPPVGEGVTPCCGVPPFELPFGHRITTRFTDVTCGRRAEERGRLLDLLVEIYDGASINQITGVDALDELITGQPGARPDVDEVRAYLDRALR